MQYVLYIDFMANVQDPNEWPSELTFIQSWNV